MVQLSGICVRMSVTLPLVLGESCEIARAAGSWKLMLTQWDENESKNWPAFRWSLFSHLWSNYLRFPRGYDFILLWPLCFDFVNLLKRHNIIWIDIYRRLCNVKYYTIIFSKMRLYPKNLIINYLASFQKRRTKFYQSVIF